MGIQLYPAISLGAVSVDVQSIADKIESTNVCILWRRQTRPYRQTLTKW